MSGLEEMFSLLGQTAMVTGADYGIGQAIAFKSDSPGARAPYVRNEDEITDGTKNGKGDFGTHTQSMVRALGREARIYTVDMISPRQIKNLVPKIVENRQEIDILVNCAGIQRRHAEMAEIPPEKYQQMMRDNLHTLFLISSAAAAHMMSRPEEEDYSRLDFRLEFGGSKRGTIINVVSHLAFQGGVTLQTYKEASDGISKLTKHLSSQWIKRGVSVNAIAPGYAFTHMNDARLQDPERVHHILARIPGVRWADAKDFKGVAVFLASTAAAFLNGETITVEDRWVGIGQ
ncbi:MAG: hypothetical protein M1825_001081 [Sarcosagium campestre]|nr:MAG: hypothetical protein M1825_001081 [Sarcosagium campestre]